VHPKADV